MAAQNDTITCADGVATAISSGAVANACICAHEDVLLFGTTANSAPTDKDLGMPLIAYAVISASTDLSNLFPGITGPYYLWAWPMTTDGKVFCSHA